MLEIFRKAASMHVRNEKYQIWTHENHAVEVFSPKFTSGKIRYIHLNPVEAGLVKRAEDYLYSSAGDYAGDKGIVNVSVLDLQLISYK